MRFLRPLEVRKNRGVSEPTLYRHIARGLLPKPVRISAGAGAVGWPDYEIAAIDAALIAGRS